MEMKCILPGDSMMKEVALKRLRVKKVEHYDWYSGPIFAPSVSLFCALVDLRFLGLFSHHVQYESATG
jgi:hypothetical protein